MHDRDRLYCAACMLLAVTCSPLLPPQAELRAADPTVSVAPGAQDGLAFRPGKWSLFRVMALNPGGDARRVSVSTRISDRPSASYSREFTLPARSKRLTWHPIYVPESLAADRHELDVETVHSDVAIQGYPAVVSQRDPVLARKSSLSLELERCVTGLLSDPQDESVRQLVVAARRTQNLSDRLTQLRIDSLPTEAEWLEIFDQLVLATDELADDPAALIAVRHWLQSGGRLWIMLDRVRPSTVAALLGDDFGLTVVDRVTLAEVAIKDLRDVPRKSHGSALQFSTPIDCVRVVTDQTSRPAFEIDNWPAAFWQNVGRGGIMFTTLGTEAWMDPALSEAGATPAAKDGPLQVLASDFFRSATPNPQFPPAAEQHAAGLVGYSIVDRRTVATLLGTYCIIGVLFTCWPFGRRGARLASLVVVLALAASGIMIAVGASARSAVAPTFVSMQLIDVAPTRGDVHVRSIVGAYRPGQTEHGIEGSHCVLSSGEPLLNRRQGRMVWTDQHLWRLDDAELPAGLSLHRFTWRQPLEKSSVIAATLTRRGIEGVLDVHQFPKAESAILAAPGRPRLAVEIAADGVFRAGSDNLLEADQFAAAPLIGDSASRRQQMYRALFPAAGQGSSLELHGPTLLFWTPPLAAPVSFGPTDRQTGDALAAIPVSIASPRSGSLIAVPPVLLPFRAVDGRDGMPVTSAYSNEQGAWVGVMVAATRITLRFQAPPAVLPLEIREATLHAEVTAPSRSVAISGWDERELIPLQTSWSPVGRRLETTIRDARILRLDDEGGLSLNIEIGPHPREEEANVSKIGWSVEQVWLDVNEGVFDPR